jgi:5-deoxy-D-glucuronate isomerase
MDKSVKFFHTLVIILIITSCTGQKKSKLTVTNYTNHTIDSLKIGNILNNKAEKIYNLKSNDSINRVYNYDSYNLPKGDHTVIGLTVFIKDFYYHQTNGYIGFPFSKVEDNYEFYIYDYGIVTKKDLKPIYPAEKYKVSEFKE